MKILKEKTSTIVFAIVRNSTIQFDPVEIANIRAFLEQISQNYIPFLPSSLPSNLDVSITQFPLVDSIPFTFLFLSFILPYLYHTLISLLSNLFTSKVSFDLARAIKPTSLLMQRRRELNETR